jgi:hypothetical protein
MKWYHWTAGVGLAFLGRKWLIQEIQNRVEDAIDSWDCARAIDDIRSGHVETIPWEEVLRQTEIERPDLSLAKDLTV